MANQTGTTVKDWFTGSSRDIVILPKWLTLRFGRLAFSIELIVLVLLAYIADKVCLDQGYGIFSKIAFVIWIAILVFIVWEFLTTIQHPAKAVRVPAVEGSLVPKWYARAITVATGVLVFILAFTMLF